MFHLAPHSTLNTSTSSLSTTSPVLLSSSSPSPDLLFTYPLIHCEDPRQDSTSTKFPSSTRRGSGIGNCPMLVEFRGERYNATSLEYQLLKLRRNGGSRRRSLIAKECNVLGTLLDVQHNSRADSPDRGEEQDNLRGESEGSSSTSRQDSSWYDGEARGDFWSISGGFIYRHLVEPRVKLYVPTGESFPIPQKYIGVTRTTDIPLDVMSEKVLDDYWNVDGDRELSDTRTGFTRFIVSNERPPDGFSWSGRTSDLKALQIMARNVETNVLCIRT